MPCHLPAEKYFTTQVTLVPHVKNSMFKHTKTIKSEKNANDFSFAGCYKIVCDLQNTGPKSPML